MSASLVGSEMCIRDSPCSVGVARAYPQCKHGSRGSSVDGSRDNAQTELPVSYTHLTLPTICSV
eukprot:6247833-Alexandrium_andersonii.AAC.1